MQVKIKIKFRGHDDLLELSLWDRGNPSTLSLLGILRADLENASGRIEVMEVTESRAETKTYQRDAKPLLS